MLLRGVPAVEILVTRLIALASLNRPKCSYSNGKGLAAFPLWETLLIPFSSAGSFSTVELAMRNQPDNSRLFSLVRSPECTYGSA